jgi:hypothetical protein
MRTRVLVEVVCTREVEIVIEHEVDEDPCDLTPDEELEAVSAANFLSRPDWIVSSVRPLREEEE